MLSMGVAYGSHYLALKVMPPDKPQTTATCSSSALQPHITKAYAACCHDADNTRSTALLQNKENSRIP